MVKSSFVPANMRSARPGITTWDFAPSYTNRLWLSWCYWYEEEVSILADVLQKIRDETFRYGFRWKPVFAKKCIACGQEYDDDVDACEICGSKNLREPDKSQLRLARVDNYNTIIEKANANGQSMSAVMRAVLFHALVTDNGFLLTLKDYKWQPDGSLRATPKEYMALDPRDVIKLFDLETGYPGKGRVCIDHRSSLMGENDKICPECKKPTFRAHYQVFTATKTSTYYIEGEITHFIIFYDGMIYGYPKSIKIKDELVTYHMIERRVRNYYEFCKVAGILFIPTDDPDSLQEMWQKTREETKDDPFTPSVLGVSEYAPTNANMIRLMQDPNGDLISIKDELRQRIASSYGVSLAFINDSSGGGMKNDKNQISLADRNIRSIQEKVNNILLRPISINMSITDWKLEVEPNINDNRLELEEIRAAQINNAERLAAMGMKVIWKGDGYTVGKGPLMSMDMLMSGMGGGAAGGMPPAGGGLPLPPSTPMGGAPMPMEAGGTTIMPGEDGSAVQTPDTLNMLDMAGAGATEEPATNPMEEQTMDDQFKSSMSNLDKLLGTDKPVPTKKKVTTKLSFLMDAIFMSDEEMEEELEAKAEEEEAASAPPMIPGMEEGGMPGMGALPPGQGAPPPGAPPAPPM